MGGQSMLKVFLSEILSSLRAKDGRRITDLIQLDFENMTSARQKPYADLNTELNASYGRANDASLSKLCKDSLPQEELGSFHSAFSESIAQYFRYLRDFTTADNQSKAYEIRQLTSQCITALGDSKYGVVMIPIVLSFSRVLAKIATNLDRNPNLLKRTTSATADTDEGAGSKVSFVESTANVLRDAFIKCLAGSPGASRSSRPAPDDKRYGIYLTANSCLKLLWQCRKLRNAQQMFLSIDAQSPPLSFYPAAQRVTYLYYLGRYHFANSHFFRAQLALQSAYDQCHRQASKHRRLILVYLIASNICLGRFPSRQLLIRPEANGLAQHFLPLCAIIKSGDIQALEDFLDLSGNHGGNSAQWFLQKRILLQLRDRCEIVTWRSLIRKTFVISGYKGEDKKIPFLRLHYVRAAARWSIAKSRASGSGKPNNTTYWGSSFGDLQSSATNNKSGTYIDSDFADLDQAINETGFDTITGQYNDTLIKHSATTTTNDNNSMTPSSATLTDDQISPTIYEIESILLSLIQQGLLRGFVLHGNPRFAIPGSQAGGGPVTKGFPRVWDVVISKAMATDGAADVVPGWVTDEILKTGAGGSMRSGGASGLGGVVRLSGARAVGMGS